MKLMKQFINGDMIEWIIRWLYSTKWMKITGPSMTDSIDASEDYSHNDGTDSKD